jgi:hypothetical protein
MNLALSIYKPNTFATVGFRTSRILELLEMVDIMPIVAFRSAPENSSAHNIEVNAYPNRKVEEGEHSAIHHHGDYEAEIETLDTRNTATPNEKGMRNMTLSINHPTGGRPKVTNSRQDTRGQ